MLVSLDGLWSAGGDVRSAPLQDDATRNARAADCERAWRQQQQLPSGLRDRRDAADATRSQISGGGPSAAILSTTALPLADGSLLASSRYDYPLYAARALWHVVQRSEEHVHPHHSADVLMRMHALWQHELSDGLWLCVGGWGRAARSVRKASTSSAPSMA